MKEGTKMYKKENRRRQNICTLSSLCLKCFPLCMSRIFPEVTEKVVGKDEIIFVERRREQLITGSDNVLVFLVFSRVQSVMLMKM